MAAPKPGRILTVLAAALVVVGLVAVPPAPAQEASVSVSGPGSVTESDRVRRVGFTITLAGGAAGGPVSVGYRTTMDGTATPNKDYIPVDGTAVFTANQTTERVTVDVLGDTLGEGDEAFTLELFNYDQIVGDPATVTIVDDDGPPRVSIADATVEEGDTSSINAHFTVALSSPSALPVSVKWATGDGTATAGADYTAGSGTLTFDPGQVSKVVTVAVAADVLDEVEEERFHVRLSEPSEVTLSSKSTGVGRIIDNDDPPMLSIADATGSEGGQAGFTVSLSTASGRRVSVSAATTGPGTATPGADYQPRSASVVFDPGQTTRTFSVSLRADGLDEPAETLQAVLSGAEAAGIARASGTGTIVDTNPGPELSVAGAEVTEGDQDTALELTVTLSGTPEAPVSVGFETAGGTATTGQDYTATTGTLTFLPGVADQTRPITVPVVGDDFAEPGEAFTVRLTGVTPAGAAQIAHGGGEATATILDDDGPPATVSVADATAVGEDTPGATAVFTVTLQRALPAPVVLTYTTVDGTATAGEDYEARSGTVEFAPGTTMADVSVPVLTDDLDEDMSETFTVELSGPVNAVIHDGTAGASITDGDATPEVSIEEDVTLEEGSEVASPGVVAVGLSAPSGRAVTVSFEFAPGNPDDPAAVAAIPDVDYRAEAVGTLVFPPGTDRRTIPVAALPDDLDEDLELFHVTISTTDASNATTAADPTATVVIEDGDVTPVVHITGPDPVVEPAADGDEETVHFTITLSAVSGREVTVPITFANGLATKPDDWRPVPESAEILISPGKIGVVASAQVVGDDGDEENEDFTATLGKLANARPPDDPADRTAAAMILDNDGPSTLTVFGSTVPEGDEATTPVPATVRLVPAPTSEVAVEWSTADGDAVAPGDYTPSSEAILTFGAGETVQTVEVAVVGDGADEAPETFTVVARPEGGSPEEEVSGTITITDDDGPTVSVDDVTVTEGTGSTTTAAFPVTLSAPSPEPVTVDYATSAGTATADEDFTSLQAQSHTFAPGETATTVAVEVPGDELDEAGEEFTLGVSNPVNATLGRSLGVATIIDDDRPALMLSAADGSTEGPSVAETDLDSTRLVFTLTRDAPTSRESSVAYATTNGRAAPGADFLPASGRVTFPPGETATTVEVAVIGDSLDEADETVRLGLSDPDNLTIPDEGLGTIVDDDGPGYALVASDGGIFNFGQAEFRGSTGDIALNQPVVGMASHPSGRGYWLVAADGGIFSFGEAGFFGSTGDLTLNRPIVGMASHPSGRGYWLVAADGGIFSFGEAGFFGSTGDLTLNRPIVGLAATPSGDGYWLVASDGGIFSFGDAVFRGSTGAMSLNEPVVGLAATPSGDGYWLVASDGGIFSFGEAVFHGSTGDVSLNRPVVGLAATPSGGGYWLVASDGGIFSFGDAGFLGSTGAMTLNRPVVGMATL